MKVILTIEEAKLHVAENFGMDVHPTNVTIEPPPSPVPSTAMNTVEAIYRIKRDYPGYNRDQKISAIKAIRTWIPGMGLADAKNFIETLDCQLDQFWCRNPSPYV